VLIFFFCYKIKEKNSLLKSPYFWLSVVTFTLLVGLRFNVGNDYNTYLMHLTYGYGVDRLEPFSRYTMEYFLANKIWPHYWFMLCAAIQIFFFLLGLKDLKKLMPYVYFFFMFYFLSFYISGIRQANAISCVFFAFSFIKERKLIPYLILILFAFLNHKSALLALPVYWIFNLDVFFSRKVQLIIILIGFFVGQTIVSYLIENYGYYLSIFGYDYLSSQIKDNEMKVEIESGWGMLFNYIVYLVVVAYSKKLHAYFKDKNFTIFYNLFLFSVFAYGFTMQDQYLARIMGFFRMGIPVVLAYTTYYFVSRKDFSIIWFPILAAFLFLEVYKWSSDKWFFCF